MRWWLVAVVWVAGCAFEVRGVGPGVGGGGVGSGADDPNGNDEQPTMPSSPMIPPVVGGGDDGGIVPWSTQIGDACDSAASPCSSGQVCETKTAFNTPIPGGYCSMDCSAVPCPAGSQCSTGWGAFKVCIQDCPAAGCRTGYVCCKKGWKAPGACLPPALCSGG